VGELPRRPSRPLDHRRAYVALRLAGDPVDAAHMRSAARFIHSCGGVERTRVFTRIWLALFDLWSWGRVADVAAGADLPAEFRPAQHLRLRLLGAPDRGRPHGGERAPAGSHHRIRHRRAPKRPRRGCARTAQLVAGRFQALDRVLKAYERHQVKFVRRAALSRAERWIVRRQEADGSWGGIQPPWVYS